MTTILAKIFINNNLEDTPSDIRRKYGVLYGATGIFLNCVLFIIKLISGFITGSVAIIADALNNLSDGGSSLISLIGFRLSGHKPDPEHPFGHGRIEYVSGLIVSMLIILMGCELFISSVKKIIHPESVRFSYIAVVILIVSILVKLYMYYYNKKGSDKFKSAVMGATAMDSLSDTIATTAVLLSMIIAHFTGLKLDGWCGLLVALFIIYAGVTSAKDTIDPLLGTKADPAFVEKIAKFVLSFDGVYGVHDLVVHDYGAGRMMISLHAEVSAEDNINEVHDTIDNIEKKLRDTLGCHAVIHMDPVLINDENTNRMKRLTELVAKSVDESLTIHDFRMTMGSTHTNLIFDVVVPYEVDMAEDQVITAIRNKIEALPGNLYAVIEVDRPLY